MEENLSELERGEQARVLRLPSTPSLRRRFLDLGLIPGSLVQCLGRAPLGDPAAYLIAGAVIAIRDRDAAQVRVNRVDRVGPDGQGGD